MSVAHVFNGSKAKLMQTCLHLACLIIKAELPSGNNTKTCESAEANQENLILVDLGR